MSSQFGENQFLNNLPSYSVPNSVNVTSKEWSGILNDPGFNRVHTGTLNSGETKSFNYGSYVTLYNNTKSAMEQANSAVGTVNTVLG